MATIRVKSAFILRRDTVANWSEKNPILREGEEGYETDTGKRKVGDGTTEWNNLKYDSGIVDQTFNPTSENAQSGKAVAEAVISEQKRANNTFANALKGSKSGAAFLISDVSPVTHDMGVKVRSKNLIPYPYAETTKTLNGVTCTDNGDGSITFNGTATATVNFYFAQTNSLFLPAGTYSLNSGNSGGKGYMLVGAADSEFSGQITGNKTFTLSKYGTVGYCLYRIEKGIVLENYTIYPQLELGTTATAYTPYVPDLTAVKVTRCGKNLFDKDMSFTDENRLPNQNYNLTYFIQLLPNTTYYVKTFNPLEPSYCGYTFINNRPNVASSISTAVCVSGNWSTAENDWHIENYITTDDSGKLYIGNNQSLVKLKKAVQEANIQIKLGSTATYYEPYITPIDYTPNADGTVDRVTALYPNTTLMTDTDGVIIDCEYNRDINKAFAELQAAIISMGGNI